MTARLPAPYASPLYAPLAPWLEQLPGRPDAPAVAALAERLDLRTASGRPVRFVPPRDDGLAYEERVWAQGEVETRPDNWHDFFNALVWMAFPRAKAAVNARHRQAWQGAGAPRGAARDAMTHFDECGMVVVASDSSLLDLLKGFHWRDLFVDRRDEARETMGYFVFGHATYEQLLAPFRGLTAKAVLYDVGAEWLGLSLTEQLTALDDRLAADLAAGRYASSRELQPLPLLGIPGVTAASEDPSYYDDTWQFRPGRSPSLPTPLPPGERGGL